MRNFILHLLTFIVFGWIMSTSAFGQGKLSGDLQLQANFYQRDSSIGAANTPQYDRQLSGGDAWLNLRYSNWGFDFGVRMDAFLNSNLIDPQDSYSAQGVGTWFVHKKIDKLDMTAGYFYDQIGSGIIFRAYEARLLSIDNALAGVRLAYDITDNIKVKTFIGRQKKVQKSVENLFELYDPVIKGASVDGSFRIGKEEVERHLQITPGMGIVNRTLDDESMDKVVAVINALPDSQKFAPKYNVYAGSVYNTLSFGRFSAYGEVALKTEEAFFDRSRNFISRPGSVFYGTLAYSQKGLGIDLQAKRTENFTLRTSPNEVLNQGFVNFLPPMQRQNTYRLTARYNAATQEIGELAFQATIQANPTERLGLLLAGSYINDLNETELYRELYFEATYRSKGKWKALAGLQMQRYNQDIFEFKPGVPLVQVVTPFAEFTYKLDRKKSLRAELSYLSSQQDLGSFVFALLEYNIAPRWSFALSDMINVVPKKYDSVKHFYSAFVAYTLGNSRFTAAYVKQVEGIVCTGGVCRYEPAFSGARLTVNTHF